MALEDPLDRYRRRNKSSVYSSLRSIGAPTALYGAVEGEGPLADPNVAKALDQYRRAVQANQAMGGTATEEREDRGLLAKALGVIGVPGEVARASLFNQWNMLADIGSKLGVTPKDWAIDIDKDGDDQDDIGPLALLGNLGAAIDPNRDIAGFGDVGALQVNDGDGLGMRLLKYAGALSGDIATDPLTYVGMPGAGTVGTKSATAMTYTGLNRFLLGADATAWRAARNLGDDALRGAGDDILRGAGDDALRAADDLASTTPFREPPARFPESTPFRTPPERWTATSPFREAPVRAAADEAAAVADEAADVLPRNFTADEAAEIAGRHAELYQKGRSIAVRRSLHEELGEELGEAAFRSLAAEPRGAMQLRLGPLARLGGKGTPKRISLTTGGGALSDRVPYLSDALLKVADKRLALRASKAGRILDKVSKGSEQYGAVVRGLAHNVDDGQRTTYRQYAGWMDINRRDAYEAGQHAIRNAEREATARSEFSQLTDDERALFLDHYFDGTELGDRGSDRLRRIINLVRAQEDEARAFARESGLDIGEIEDARRVALEEWLAERNLRAADGFGARASDSTRRRVANVQVGAGEGGDDLWESVRAINARRRAAGEAAKYEEDPFTISRKVAENLYRKGAEARRLREYRDLGILRTADDDALSVSRVFQSKPTQEWLRAQADADLASDRLNKLGAALGKARHSGDAEAIARAQADFDKAAEQTRNLGDLLDTIASTEGAEQYRAIESAVRQVLDMRHEDVTRLARTAGVTDDTVAAAKAAQEEAIKAAEALRTTDGVLSDEFIADAQAAGMRRLGHLGADQSNRANRAVSLPEGLQNSFARPEFADALERLHRITDPNTAKGIVADFWDPFMSVWKTWVTVGAGPKFAARNLSGGIWNGYLFGAGARHWRIGAKYQKAMMRAEAAMRKALKDGKVFEAADAKGVRADRFFEEMLRRDLEKVTFGDTNLWEMHKALTASGLGGHTASINTAALDNADSAAGAIAAVLNDKRNLFQHRGAADELGRAPRAVNTLVNNPWVRANARLSERAEHMLRMGTFAAGVERYGGDAAGMELASILVKSSQFDYADLSPAEVLLYKKLGLAPFAVWTKNNVPLQVRAILTEPGKVNQMAYAMENAQRSFGADGENASIDALLPEWLDEAFGFTSDASFDGNPVVFGMNSPLTDVNRFLSVPDNPLNPVAWVETMASASGDDAKGTLGPVWKAGLEAISGRNTFTGADFTDRPVTPLYDAIDFLPFLPEAYTNEQGQRVASDYAPTQLRNLLPALGQLERNIPYGPWHNEAYQGRRATTWLSSSGLGPLLPIEAKATLTPSQLSGELWRRRDDVSDQNKRLAGDRIDTDRLNKAVAAANGDPTHLARLAELVRSGYFDRA